MFYDKLTNDPIHKIYILQANLREWITVNSLQLKWCIEIY